MTGRPAALAGRRGLTERTLLPPHLLDRLLPIASLALLVVTLTACNPSSTSTPSPSPAGTATPAPVATSASLPAPTPSPIALPVLRVGVDAANRPWCFRNAAGELVGLDVDLVTALAARMGVRVEYVNTAPHLLLPGLASQKYDVVAAGLVATAERQGEASLSDPYFSLGQIVVVRATDTLTGPVALAGKVAGVQIGSPAVAEARRLGATPRLYDDLSIALGALARGEVSAVIGDDLGAADYLAAYPDARLRRAGTAFAPVPVVLAVAKDQPALLDRVSSALGALRQSGALDQLAGKWLR